MQGETRYARSGELNIAYQVLGDGPIDFVFTPGYMSHLEQNQWWPAYRNFLERMASFSRLLVFDRRGTGLSDRILTLGSFEEMMDDIRAVMDAAGSERAALLGGAEGGPICALFAATFPERTSALVLVGSYARRTWAPDYPWGLEEEAQQAHPRGVREELGQEGFRAQHARTLGRRRRAVRGVVRAGLQVRRHAVLRPGVVPGHDGDRHPRRPARDPGADARRPALGRPRDPARGRALPRRAHPRREVRRRWTASTIFPSPREPRPSSTRSRSS